MVTHAMVLLPFMFLLATASENGAIKKNVNTKPSLNVMLMEADLLSSDACKQVRRASSFPTSVEYMGYWFCFESVLGRFVDYTTIKYTKQANLVHYRLKQKTLCEHARFTNVRDAYIYNGHSKDGKLKIIEHFEDEAFESEFVQKAITAIELMAEMMCMETAPNK